MRIAMRSLLDFPGSATPAQVAATIIHWCESNDGARSGTARPTRRAYRCPRAVLRSSRRSVAHARFCDGDCQDAVEGERLASGAARSGAEGEKLAWSLGLAAIHRALLVRAR